MLQDRLVVCSLVVFMALAAWAQARVDAQGPAPGRTRSTATDAEGRFTIAGLAGGPVRVTVTSLGVDPRVLESTVPSARDGLKVELRPAGFEETASNGPVT